MKIDSIRIIQKISKFISISFLTISCIITLILLYILLGGSLEGNIEIDTMINNSNNLNEYKKLDLGKNKYYFSFDQEVPNNFQLKIKEVFSFK